MKSRSGHFIIYGRQSEHNKLVVELLQLLIKADDHASERSELLSRNGKSTEEIAQDKEWKESKKHLNEARKNLSTALQLVAVDIIEATD